ncbi:uncharacterized protein VICG_00849 [Vittaforma corneae ATCC 50505]|uniref:Uncharacterized protein n=1 Tax=Vittaforma corneae (strain ATCC 50505) TaxID=993615 RepID=L2GN06_VITCO|nr:uncharacterized protein VICG_00849 [Vittaforma corneae ATCC 50505]ELA42206.1 hypothetical protein VICG_00849 [Vittaforma corneae ATCC 50505]
MDRKSQIFAPTISVGGVRKPVKKQIGAESGTNLMFKKVCDSMKNDLKPTLVKSFSYKYGEDVFNINDAKIKSIGKNKKHVAFLITGNPTTIDERQAVRESSSSEGVGEKTEDTVE